MSSYECGTSGEQALHLVLNILFSFTFWILAMVHAVWFCFWRSPTSLEVEPKEVGPTVNSTIPTITSPPPPVYTISEPPPAYSEHPGPGVPAPSCPLVGEKAPNNSACPV